VQQFHMSGSYVVYRQESPASAHLLDYYRIMDLLQSNDALQSLHLILQTGSVHADRSTQTMAEILDGSPRHNVLVLRLTRFPLETCLLQAMASCADLVSHPVHGHLPAQA